MSFLIGTATSAHQTEGNNTFSDCRVMKQMPGSSLCEPSGEAVDRYHRFAEDIRLLAQAGLNAEFGSIAVDRSTLRRMPKASLFVWANGQRNLRCCPNPKKIDYI